MEINYEITLEDLYKFEKKHLKEKDAFFRNTIFIKALLIVTIYSLWYPSQINIGENEKTKLCNSEFLYDFAFNMVIALLLIFYFRYKSLNRKQLKKVVTERPSIIGKRNLKTNNEKIIITQNQIKTEIEISEFKKVEKDNDFYFLTSRDKSLLIYIPKNNVSESDIMHLKNSIEKNDR